MRARYPSDGPARGSVHARVDAALGADGARSVAVGDTRGLAMGDRRRLDVGHADGDHVRRPPGRTVLLHLRIGAGSPG